MRAETAPVPPGDALGSANAEERVRRAGCDAVPLHQRHPRAEQIVVVKSVNDRNLLAPTNLPDTRADAWKVVGMHDVGSMRGYSARQSSPRERQPILSVVLYPYFGRFPASPCRVTR